VRTRRYYVAFLRHAIDSKDLLARLPPPKRGLEEVLYREMTVRNLNTTTKLAAMLAELDEAPLPAAGTRRQNAPLASPRRVTKGKRAT